MDPIFLSSGDVIVNGRATDNPKAILPEPPTT